MTELLFRDDAYLKSCSSTVVALHGDAVELDRTVFYPMGGGQPGDFSSAGLVHRDESRFARGSRHPPFGRMGLGQRQPAEQR